MSYDPRQGASPYLGMEVDEEVRQERTARPAASARDPQPTRQAQPRTTRRTGASRPQDPRTRQQARPQSTRRATRRGAPGVPQTELRPSAAPQRGVAPLQRGDTGEMPVIRRPQAAPAPRQVAYGEPARPARRSGGVFGWLGSVALVLLAWVLRALAIALSLTVVASALLTSARRATLVDVLNLVSSLVPAGLEGHFVMETPFGGALRGDLAIAAIILFLADWLCLVLSTSLREGRERGAY